MIKQYQFIPILALSTALLVTCPFNSHAAFSTNQSGDAYYDSGSVVIGDDYNQWYTPLLSVEVGAFFANGFFSYGNIEAPQIDTWYSLRTWGSIFVDDSMVINSSGEWVGAAIPKNKISTMGTWSTSDIPALGFSHLPISSTDVSNWNQVITDLSLLEASLPWGSSGGNIHFTGGNVSIGHSTPIGTLRIEHGTLNAMSDTATLNAFHHVLTRNASNNEHGIGIAFKITGGMGSGNSTPGAAIIHERIGSHSLGKLHFKTHRDGTNAMSPLSTTMTLDHAGRVGIGTTDPDATLEVVGDVVIDGDTIFHGTVRLAQAQGDIPMGVFGPSN